MHAKWQLKCRFMQQLCYVTIWFLTLPNDCCFTKYMRCHFWLHRTDKCILIFFFYLLFSSKWSPSYTNYSKYGMDGILLHNPNNINENYPTMHKILLGNAFQWNPCIFYYFRKSIRITCELFQSGTILVLVIISASIQPKHSRLPIFSFIWDAIVRCSLSRSLYTWRSVCFAIETWPETPYAVCVI